MKTKLIGSLLIVSSFLFYSCGGGNSVKKNETFGKIPSLVSNFMKSDSIHNAKAENDAKNLKLSDLKGYLEKFKKETDEAEAKLKADVKAETALLKDKPVPFKVENENFEIKELKISDEEVNDGKGLKLPFKFTVKKPINLPPYSNGYTLKYKLMDKNGNMIGSEQQMTLILGENYDTKVVQPGKEVTGDIYLSMKKPAMADFKEIVFF